MICISIRTHDCLLEHVLLRHGDQVKTGLHLGICDESDWLEIKPPPYFSLSELVVLNLAREK